jgi:hypothetical protein
LFRDLKLGRRLRRDNINRVGDIRLRSHFAASPEVPIVLEKSLKSKGFTHPVVFEYRAWSPDILLEPDEIIIDVLTSEVRSTNDIGKLILWVIDKFEDLTSKVNDYIYMSQKIELESSYRSLVARAFELTMQETSVEYNPWPLSDFGLFGDVSIPHSKGGVWTASAGLDDDVVKHIVRDRSKNVPGYLKAQYAELLGLRDLRKRIRQQQKAKERRHRWILITGSLILRREANDVIEFDGGLIKISSRSGRMTWYGLECKSGRTNPLSSLRRRLNNLGMQGSIHRLGSHYAFVEMVI